MLPTLLLALASFNSPSLDALGWEGDLKHQFVAVENGESFLRSQYAPADGEANFARKEIHWDAKALPYLRWRWRARKFPRGAKINDGDKSDAAAQVYVLWRSFPRTWVIKYFWATDDAVGTELRQSRFLVGSLFGLVLHKGPGDGGWVTETRNLAEDFRKGFDREMPGEALGIAVMSDGDETKSESAADYGDFEASAAP